jgi:hypothetical protein
MTRARQGPDAVAGPSAAGTMEASRRSRCRNGGSLCLVLICPEGEHHAPLSSPPGVGPSWRRRPPEFDPHLPTSPSPGDWRHPERCQRSHEAQEGGGKTHPLVSSSLPGSRTGSRSGQKGDDLRNQTPAGLPWHLWSDPWRYRASSRLSRRGGGTPASPEVSK